MSRSRIFAQKPEQLLVNSPLPSCKPATRRFVPDIEPPDNTHDAGAFHYDFSAVPGGNSQPVDMAHMNRVAVRVLREAMASRTHAEAGVDAYVDRALNDGGALLSPRERSFMEPRFGRDFSSVRVHTGPAAAKAAERLDARAFTVGQDIAFGAGEYAPEHASGRRLLAHELAHTLQQGGPRPPGPLVVSQPGDPFERQADAMARSAVDGVSLAATAAAPVHIARAPEVATEGNQGTKHEAVPVAPSDIHDQWAAKKEAFKRVADDPANTLRSQQMYTIWSHHWMDRQRAALEDVARIEQRLRSANAGAYAENKSLFDMGKRDALGAEYEAAATERDAANGVMSEILDVIDWLDVRVDVLGHHVTLDEVNKRANDMAKAKWWYRLAMGVVILGAAGVAARAPSRRAGPVQSSGPVKGPGASEGPGLAQGGGSPKTGGSAKIAPEPTPPKQGRKASEAVRTAATDQTSTTPKAPNAPKNLPPLRQQYVDAVKALADKVPAMRQSGMTSEQIARTLHAERRALGVQYKELTPPEKLAEIYERNTKRYGDKLGPSIEWLKERGKSWDQIIESATRSGGKDLGF